MSADLSFSSPQSDADGQGIGCIETDNHIDVCQCLEKPLVSAVLLDAIPAAEPAPTTRSGTAWKRLRYVISLCYWTARHRSLSRGRWVAAYSCGEMK